MLNTLDAIVRRVIEGYDPERVILFGSRATGRAHDQSDFDLLIIKQDERRPLDRRIDVERLLADRRVPIDLVVYTPREMWELFQAGSPFIEEVLDSGRVLYMRNATEGWLREATDELDTAAILLDHQRFRAVCFHSQHAAEKALKAVLVEEAQRPPRTHDIVDLLNTVRAASRPVSMTTDEAVFLTSVYRGRYPTDLGLLPHGEPSAQDAQRAFDTATRALGSVRVALGRREIDETPIERAAEHQSGDEDAEGEKREE